MDIKKLVHSAMICFLTTSSATAIAASSDTSSQTNSDNMEKCYGIVKAGMNDCQTASQSCAGSSTQDKQADAFLFLPKGACSKIVGGNLTSPPTTKDTKAK